ncbi:MAG: MaoC family dehydratase, partial [Actinomycetota bacterium]
TIYAVTTVTDKVPSSSKPDRGVVTVESRGFNQDGVEVCFFRRKVLVWRREFAPKRRFPYTD